MALVIPEYLWTKKYSAERDRLALQNSAPNRAGVVGQQDFRMSQRAAGANMSVDVAAGFALVDANSPGNQGLYHVQNDGTTNVPIAASHASLPRIDQVFLEVNDSTDGGDVADNAVFTVVAGTPTAGATLSNLLGQGVAPLNALRLGTVLVPAASSTVTTPNIGTELRPFAHGRHFMRAFKDGSAQVYANNTIVPMQFDTMYEGWQGAWVPGTPTRIFVPHTGFRAYLLEAFIDWPDVANLSTEFHIRANSAGSVTGGPSTNSWLAYASAATAATAVTGTTRHSFTTLLTYDDFGTRGIEGWGAGDYIEIFAGQSSTASRTANWQGMRLIDLGPTYVNV